ncbi:TIGR02234 family membrane protein [Gordonia sp. N1V]|uniref:TIGR02234 family membrane protein n=1 Tax=Gordonia sp. N1V TaxID=3034163 RepID=UPI0023E23023|nr:TIGR02234 family membrane protein [Gordonia sp. N1V]MDF3280161.1 TIGR02234 family membrane protein [Gordonia sp. N1V]
MSEQTPDPTTPDAAETARGSRRIKVIAAILMALGALAFWSASRVTWATVFAGDGMSPDRYMQVKGADWSPWLTPLALVLLAAILAAFSLRGWGLRIVAVLVAAGGLLAAFPALSLLTSSSDSLYAARAIDLSDRYVVRLTTTHGWVSVVVFAGTVCCVAAGVLLLRSASGAGMSSKYRTPAARRDELEREIFAEHERRKAAGDAGTEPAGGLTGRDGTNAAADGEDAARTEPPHVNERMMWDALDTGIDPTEQR